MYLCGYAFSQGVLMVVSMCFVGFWIQWEERERDVVYERGGGGDEC